MDAKKWAGMVLPGYTGTQAHVEAVFIRKFRIYLSCFERKRKTNLQNKIITFLIRYVFEKKHLVKPLYLR